MKKLGAILCALFVVSMLFNVAIAGTIKMDELRGQIVINGDITFSDGAGKSQGTINAKEFKFKGNVKESFKILLVEYLKVTTAYNTLVKQIKAAEAAAIAARSPVEEGEPTEKKEEAKEEKK